MARKRRPQCQGLCPSGIPTSVCAVAAQGGEKGGIRYSRRGAKSPLGACELIWAHPKARQAPRVRGGCAWAPLTRLSFVFPQKKVSVEKPQQVFLGCCGLGP